MKRVLLTQAISILLLGLGTTTFSYAASPGPELLGAKKKAEGMGYSFFTSHDDIVAGAKKEGRLRVLAGMEPPNMKASAAAFIKKYPFIDLHIQEITGTDAAERNIAEIRSGAKDWDVHRLSTDRYADYVPYLLKVDILGMAEHGVLQIPPPMVDPKQRNALAFYNRFQVTAYNKNLLPQNLIPTSWEDLLKPELKGGKFMLDIRALDISALVPAWGLERTVEFARKLAAQQPVWIRGGARGIAAVIAGEVPMIVGANNTSVKRAQARDPTGVLQYVILEPVPLRQGELEGIQVTAQNPYAALLWFEWMASLEAQKIADEHEPLASSIFVRGGAVEQQLSGKKLSVLDWEHEQKMGDWQKKIIEAYGFPRVQRTKR